MTTQFYTGVCYLAFIIVVLALLAAVCWAIYVVCWMLSHPLKRWYRWTVSQFVPQPVPVVAPINPAKTQVRGTSVKENGTWVLD